MINGKNILVVLIIIYVFFIRNIDLFAQNKDSLILLDSVNKIEYIIPVKQILTVTLNDGSIWAATNFTYQNDSIFFNSQVFISDSGEIIGHLEYRSVYKISNSKDTLISTTISSIQNIEYIDYPIEEYDDRVFSLHQSAMNSVMFPFMGVLVGIFTIIEGNYSLGLGCFGFAVIHYLYTKLRIRKVEKTNKIYINNNYKIIN